MEQRASKLAALLDNEELHPVETRLAFGDDAKPVGPRGQRSSVSRLISHAMKNLHVNMFMRDFPIYPTVVEAEVLAGGVVTVAAQELGIKTISARIATDDEYLRGLASVVCLSHSGWLLYVDCSTDLDKTVCSSYPGPGLCTELCAWSI